MAMPGQLMFARRLGPTARLAIWFAIGVACVVLDVRYQAMEGLRSGLALLLEPVRVVLRAPTEVAVELNGFFTRHRLLQKERDELLAERARLRLDAEAARDLARENAALRALLGLRERPGQRAVQAALLYQGHDWFTQRITLDRGASSGLTDGLPVIDDAGLLGQLTRVYAGSSEVTLVSSPEQLTPVYIERTGQRGLAAGTGHGRLELRYMPTQADVRVGDRLLTSGIDRVYPPALPVARITRITRSQSGPYLRVECAPLAGLDRARAVLVLAAAPAPHPAAPQTSGKATR
jgi:rod shape-determining protein MreC